MIGGRLRLRRGDAMLMALALAAFALAVRALERPAPPHAVAQVAEVKATGSPSASASPAPPPAPVAFVSAYGAVALRWTGPGDCAASSTEVSASADSGRTWKDVAVPFGALRALALGPAGAGMARGCGDAVAVTKDGGRTWRTGADPGWRVDPTGEVVGPADTVPKADPCEEVGQGTASLVADASATDAWVLCQRADGADRLLVRTRDGGATWQRLAGRRPETGLAGTGRVTALRFTGRSVGVAVVDGACAAGEVRRTVDGGAHWTTVKCLPGIDRVLDVAAGGTRTLLAVGLRGEQVVLLRSADAGATWT